jgi:hypothetical protein
MVIQLVKKLAAFMESKDSSHCSQKPTIGAYSAIVESSPQDDILFLHFLLHLPCVQIYFLSTFLSDPLASCLSLRMRDQISFAYKTTGNISFIYILLFLRLDMNK